MKRRRRIKNQEFDFVVKTVLNIDVVLLLEKIRLECLYNFGYFATIILKGAIDVLLLRVGCQQVDHFVGALWI